MAQVKVYGLDRQITANRQKISEAIHASLMSAFEYPPEKKFHRFIGLDKEDFIYPEDRSDSYTIIEFSVFEGRSEQAKKTLIRELFSNLEQLAGITPQDVEITIFETSKANWGIRGKPGDELALNYKVDV
jgi:phenylpyruvate tautomerase PptA (4-oxalocrotonate tautomerase family)